MRVGILALQGDFEAHAKALAKAGASSAEIRTAAELTQVDGLIIPGGESTTMLKLIDIEGLFEPLRHFAQSKPVFGTCAGAILVAAAVTNPVQKSLQIMDIDVERNAYGRQRDSRIGSIDFDGAPIEAVFIRAPIIRRVGPGAITLSTYLGDPVLVQQGRHLVATFHPELTADPTIHGLFVDMIKRNA